jgi:hypothetical protein
MLLQAVQDTMSSSSGRRNGAIRWINSKDNGPFSFAFVCRVLNRDEDYVRRFCLRKASERRTPEAPVRRFIHESYFTASSAA